jgi:WD40 repeat protein
LDTGRELRTLEGHSSSVTGVGGDTGRQAGSFRISRQNAESMEPGDRRQAQRTLEGHLSGVHGVVVTRDGKRAVSASMDNTARVWDLETGRALLTLEGHSQSVSGVAVTPDGRLISASYDETLRVWQIDTDLALRKRGRPL